MSEVENLSLVAVLYVVVFTMSKTIEVWEWLGMDVKGRWGGVGEGPTPPL